MTIKWFPIMNKKDQVRMLKYLERLSHINDHRLKVETMMNTTGYLESFCEECIEVWNKIQDKKSIREIDDNTGPPNKEFQEQLF